MFVSFPGLDDSVVIVGINELFVNGPGWVEKEDKIMLDNVLLNLDCFLLPLHFLKG